jgi:hypothetical protein
MKNQKRDGGGAGLQDWLSYQARTAAAVHPETDVIDWDDGIEVQEEWLPRELCEQRMREGSEQAQPTESDAADPPVIELQNVPLEYVPPTGGRSRKTLESQLTLDDIEIEYVEPPAVDAPTAVDIPMQIVASQDEPAAPETIAPVPADEPATVVVQTPGELQDEDDDHIERTQPMSGDLQATAAAELTVIESVEPRALSMPISAVDGGIECAEPVFQACAG